MAIESGGYGAAWGKDASEIMLDPHKRLAAAVVVQAVKDIQDQDILRSVDALLWWLSDGPVWLQLLDFDEGHHPDEVFLSLARGDYVKRKQFTQPAE